MPVADRAREPDLPLAFVETDDTGRLSDEVLHHLARPTGRPVGVVRDEVVDRVDVDPVDVVVELEALGQLAPHAESVRRRNPPWNSYDEAMTASASRAARALSSTAPASAIGAGSSASIPRRPAAESAIASARQLPQTAPPARGE